MLILDNLIILLINIYALLFYRGNAKTDIMNHNICFEVNLNINMFKNAILLKPWCFLFLTS